MNPFEEALLRYLTPEQLTKIQATKVGIAGAGGLGSNCATALVRSGFRNIKILDFDTVEYSNLNRQFYFLDQVGRPKVEALHENLKLINPDVDLEILRVRAEEDNVAALFSDCDVVVEAFDRAEYKQLVIETYLNTGKLLVAASGLAGWGNSDRLQIHKIKENFFLVGDLVTGVGPDCPPLAPCVAIAAAKQADVVLSYVLGPMKGTGENV